MVKSESKQKLEEGIKAVKWLVEEKYKITPEKASEILRRSDFKKNNLETMLTTVFDRSIHNALTTAYPDNFSEEDYSKRYRGNYKGKWVGKPEKVIAAVKDLFENQLKIPIDNIPKKVSAKLFYDNGLSAVLASFHSSTYRAIQTAYPGKFKPWEFKNKPKGIWKGKVGLKNAAGATRWLVKEKLKIPVEEAPEILTGQIFREHGIQGLLNTIFGGNNFYQRKSDKKAVLRALVNAYPNKFSIEDKKKVGIQVNENEINEIIRELEPSLQFIARKHYIPNGKDELEDLIQYGRLGIFKALEDRGLKKEDIKDKKNLFLKYAQTSILVNRKDKDRVFKRAKSIDRVFSQDDGRTLLDTLSEKDIVPWGDQPVLQPGKVKRKQFLNILKKRLSGEEYTKLEDEIEKSLTEAESFSWHPIKEGMSFLKNNTSRYQNLKYPWEFGIPVPRGSWQGQQGLERGKKAIKYVLEEKLKIPLEKIPEVANVRFFAENNLIGMFIEVFKGHVFDAIDSAYPNIFRPWQFGAHIWNSPDAKKYAGELVRYVIEKKMNIHPIDALKKINLARFREQGLAGMLGQYLPPNNEGVIKAISIAYPALFPKEKIEMAINFVKKQTPQNKYKNWQILKALEITHKDWDPIVEAAVFLENTQSKAERKKIWRVGDIFGQNRVVNAVKWLIEKKLQIPLEEIPLKISTNSFRKYDLENILSRVGSSPYHAVDLTYPGKFKPWEFKYRRNWKTKEGDETAIDAVK